MDCAIGQFLLGGALVILALAWKAFDVEKLIHNAFPEKKKLSAVVNALLHLAVGVVAAMLILKPLVPGAAIAEIHAPATFPTTLDNLTVHATPACSSGGHAGMTKSGAFDRTGVALVPVEFHLLQDHLLVEVLDASQNPRLVRHQDVYVSVLQRRGFSKLVVFF